jgi:hypothetical protein
MNKMTHADWAAILAIAFAAILAIGVLRHDMLRGRGFRVWILALAADFTATVYFVAGARWAIAAGSAGFILSALSARK